jgi:hypothetical protein
MARGSPQQVVGSERVLQMLRCIQRIRALPGLRAAAFAGVAAATALASAGCAANHTGRLLGRGGISVGAAPVRPGVELGWYYVFLHNTSKSTLTIQSIELRGPGVGRVVSLTEVQIAPLRIGYHRAAGKGGAPGGFYDEDPPVVHGASACSAPQLEPARGFRMTPGSMARIWLVVRALRPGRWAIPAHVIRYSADGVMYRQSLAYRFSGSVASDARYIPLDAYDAKCIGPMGARLLAGHHLPG